MSGNLIFTRGDMSDNLPAKKRRLTDLTKEERADIGHEVFVAHGKGSSYRALAKQYNITEYAVKDLVIEYGAYLQKSRGYTKEANIEGYNFILENAAKIIENPEGHPALVRAKAYEAFIQSLTRKDKLLGHEAPTHNINTKGESLIDIVRQKFGADGDQEGISPMDSAHVGEAEDEILDAEVIDDFGEE